MRLTCLVCRSRPRPKLSTLCGCAHKILKSATANKLGQNRTVPGVVGDYGEILDFGIAQGNDEVLRDAAETEAWLRKL